MAAGPARSPPSRARRLAAEREERPTPGPPLLYAPQPRVPQLDVRAPFKAQPLLVSGTDAYRDGEYLYQDYLFDDHGADAKPGGSTPPGYGAASQTRGDVRYPTAARFSNNAADLVELRIRPTPDAIVYRVTLNTMLDENAAAVVIGVDRDRSGGPPSPGREARASARRESIASSWRGVPGARSSRPPAGPRRRSLRGR